MDVTHHRHQHQAAEYVLTLSYAEVLDLRDALDMAAGLSDYGTRVTRKLSGAITAALAASGH